MAIVVQPPFYAPRPPDEPIWTGKPMASKLIVGLLTATTVYGAPGQAPTKQWRSDYAEAAGWQGAPRANPLLTNATPAVTFYGAPGQAPTKLWRYDYVEAPPWGGRYFLTEEAVQVLPYFATKQWHCDPQADVTNWQGQPLPAYTLYLPASSTQSFSKQWR